MEMSPELGAAIVSLIVAAAGWLKNHSEVVSINQDRENTKAVRDADSQQVHDDMIRAKERLGAQQNQIKALFGQMTDSNKAITVLQNQNASIITLMKTIVKSIDELKTEFKNSRNGQN